MKAEYKKLIKEGYMREATVAEYAEWLENYFLLTDENIAPLNMGLYGEKYKYLLEDSNLFVALKDIDLKGRSFLVLDDGAKIIILKNKNFNIEGPASNIFDMNKATAYNNFIIPLSDKIIDELEKRGNLEKSSIDKLRDFYLHAKQLYKKQVTGNFIPLKKDKEFLPKTKNLFQEFKLSLKYTRINNVKFMFNQVDILEKRKEELVLSRVNLTNKKHKIESQIKENYKTQEDLDKHLENLKSKIKANEISKP